MTKFLIQTVNKQVKHDFAFHLIEAIRFNNWFYNQKVYEYTISESESVKSGADFIPIGSLEFVFEYLEKYHHITSNEIHPINVPAELRNHEFLKRNVTVISKDKLILNKPKFIKSNTKYKSFASIFSQIDDIPKDELFISDIVDIDSEWRGFVFQKKLVGLQHYLGDFTKFPDVPFIKDIIHSYYSSPAAYTVDIGISGNDNFLIEIHPFVSCGLYGFHEYKYLPEMFIQGFRYLLSGNKHNHV